ncbi:MAG: ribonuclease P protein component [Desulfarculales bacterium]|jgi:ribonuclease P protein component|nr:ribonuclease P protein component [Desulfarculales bacterium]
MAGQTFPKANRLRRRPEFVAAQQYERRRKREGLIFLLRPNPVAVTRLGITVTRRSQPLAVRRNRARRLLREAFRLNYGLLPQGWDLLVIVTKEALGLTLPQAGKAILWAMGR